jgi:hypothetical protein
MFYYSTKISLRTLIALLLLSLGFWSCESEREPAAFYPIDSLVREQVLHLAEIQAGLFKEALLSGKTDTVKYIPADTAAWMKELEIFRKLNEINKPVNKGNYEVSDGLIDPESNLTVKAFTSLRELPVVYLKIYYQGRITKPRKIEALYDEENFLYESSRILSMHFEQIDNKTVLTAWSIKGGQHMIFGDSVTFYITGKILVD